MPFSPEDLAQLGGFIGSIVDQKLAASGDGLQGPCLSGRRARR
jgi:hypothetical protein